MKNPIKILDRNLKTDVVEIQFAFPWEEKSGFKEQIGNFWKVFQDRNSKIDGVFVKLAQCIQSVSETHAQLKIYSETKKELISALSISINNFINLHEEDKNNSLIEIPKNLRHDIQMALKSYNENANLLKNAYRYEHLYLKEMISSFNVIKETAAEVFHRHELMADKIDSLNDSYLATVRLAFNNYLSIEDFVIKDHTDFKELKFQSSVLNFIKNCLQKIIIDEFDELDTEAKYQLDSFLLTDEFLSNFKEQEILVEDYIKEYQNTIRIQQKLLDLNDYKVRIYLKSSFLEKKNKIINENLSNLWDQFSNHYETILVQVQDMPAIVNKVKKQIVKITLKDFFILDRNKVMEQVLTDVSVDDFDEAYSFLTWKTLYRENSAFCHKIKSNFFNKYASKYELEQVQPGVFFSELNGEFRLVFISFDSEYSSSLENFINRIENKYQKMWQEIKSIKSQKIGDILDMVYLEQKITVPVQYFFFNFKDPGLLQSIKKLQMT